MNLHCCKAANLYHFRYMMWEDCWSCWKKTHFQQIVLMP